MSPADIGQKDRTATNRTQDTDKDSATSVEPGPNAKMADETATGQTSSDVEQANSAPTLVLPLDQAGARCVGLRS